MRYLLVSDMFRHPEFLASGWVMHASFCSEKVLSPRRIVPPCQHYSMLCLKWLSSKRNLDRENTCTQRKKIPWSFGSPWSAGSLMGQGHCGLAGDFPNHQNVPICIYYQHQLGCMGHFSVRLGSKAERQSDSVLPKVWVTPPTEKHAHSSFGSQISSGSRLSWNFINWQASRKVIEDKQR